MKTFEWEGMHDGYGIVGVGFTCPYCRHLNTFVDEEFEPHECKKCKKESIPEGPCFEW